MKYQTEAKIISNEEIALEHFKMTLFAPDIAKAAKPGQFVHVRCSDGTDPLLRRPFSIHRVSSLIPHPSSLVSKHEPRGTIEILYKVVGKGTGILSGRKSGETLDVIGPLGNGFTLQPSAFSLQPSAILVAGGIGVAPLLFLAEKFIRHSSIVPRLSVIIGVRTRKLLLCEEEFRRLGVKVIVATEDGSRGKKGLASDVLDSILKERPSSLIPHPSSIVSRPSSPGAIYACGPRAMLEAIADIACRRKIPCQVSLEEHMACGIGACLGCAISTRPSSIVHHPSVVYKRVCADGPVFDASEIIW